MIDLSIDLSYLARYYGISTARTFAAQTGQITGTESGNEDEMLTIITEDGSITVNADLLAKMLEEPEKLAKILKLEDPENRYLIIQQLNEEDLTALLPFLTSEQLAFGLQYFTTEGLNELMVALPGEEMVNLLLQHFTMEDVVPFMQQNEMDEFFKSTELEQEDVMEYLEGLEYEKFQALMVNQFGYEYKDKTSEEYLDYISNMEDKEYQQFLLNMQIDEKGEMIAGLCDINPDYYLCFDNSILARPIINNLDKEDIIKTMTTLDPEFLVPMVEELPEDLIQVVATQIDPTDFSEILSREFPDLIMEMLAG